jgi:hypothetical protein
MLLEQKKVENEAGLVFHGAELKTPAGPGGVTGAFGHMEYAEVGRFAAVYGLQVRSAGTGTPAGLRRDARRHRC